ncbi:HAD family hydrolase [Maritimibacter sp. UBA3975]|uniref:HAD family hydrolase n=1 Tax=Maritimibacter sp. UBA3975 TaxID=1946833 RepID=UPI000C0A8D99|nr:HAD family hydrolase [Maritimibacter sp. UBA3975]MAM63383.1 hydrolase [Maritimibacter sp.]|tara:strand:- start:97506 stop:98183 length:678 start_codon:yes stop_codon:yes gene_type:complete
MTPTLAPRLVIFDCDGVLVDSETISLSVLLDYLGAAGARISEAEGYRHLLGRSIASNAAWLRAEHGVDLDEAAQSTLRHTLFDRFRAELEPVLGVQEVLDALDCPYCVASSSQPDRIRFSLTVTGLIDRFEPFIFSASQVANGKPAPDLFLLAASEMGVEPRDCLVVEDSPAGVHAARAAVMPVVGFTGGSHAGPANLNAVVASAGPDAIIETMQDLRALLRVSV